MRLPKEARLWRASSCNAVMINRSFLSSSINLKFQKVTDELKVYDASFDA